MRAVQAAKDFQGIANGLADRISELLAEEVGPLVEQLGAHLSGEVKGCCIGYVRLKALPFVKSVVAAVCCEQPANPVAFAAVLLAEQLQAPEPCLAALRAHAGDHQDLDLSAQPLAGGDREAAVRPPATRRPSAGRASPQQKRLQLRLADDGGGPLGRSASEVLGLEPPSPLPSAREEGRSPSSRRGDSKSSSPSRPGRKARPEGGVSFGDTDGAESPGGSSVASVNRNPTVIHTTRLLSQDSAKRKAYLRRTLKLEAGIKPVPQDELLSLLRAVPYLQQFTDDQLASIANVAEMRRFEQDESLMSFGQNCEELHIVLEGSGNIYVPQQAGQLRRGDFVGQEALKVAGAKSSSHITAVGGPLTTLAISRSQFEELGLRARRVERSRDAIKGAGEAAGGLLGLALEVEPGYCPACLHKMVEGYQKTAADKLMIIQAAKHNKVLGEVMGLSDEQCEMIADAVHLVEVPAGVLVFRKGEKGTALFIVQEGLLKVHLDQKLDVKLRVGDTFGELALLYDEPRSASIEALMCCRLWVMPRHAFQEVSRISARRRLAEYAELLKRVPCLVEAIEPSLFEMLAGVVEETVFAEEDCICDAGQDEGMLFLVYEGECSYQENEDDDGDEECKVLRKGDWIGEEQLIKNIFATRTVTVTSETATVLVLQESSFNLVVDAGLTLRRSNSMAQQALEGLGGRLSIERGGLEGAPSEDALHRCTVVGALGEGSFGRVLLLRDSSTHKEYALKCMSKEHLRNERQEAMVQKERNTMMLLDSDFIVRLYGSYEDSEFLYLMLEPVLGGELFDVYTDHDLWGKVGHARFYVASVALGLSHMHSKRIIWRDLKLENCLIDTRGHVKLTDMGIAKVVVGKTYTVCGTVDYFAPETLKQVGHNRAADWWACGVLLFIMIAGRSPFDAPEVPQIYKNIIKGLAKVPFPPSCPSEAEEVIKALCKKKPEDRVTMQKGGINNLKSMSFFDGLDWHALAAQQVEAPYIPSLPDYERIAGRKLTKEIDIRWEEVREWGDPAPGPAAAGAEAEGEAEAEAEEEGPDWGPQATEL